jgi:DNA-binding beta-propeller fold protein YncE
MDSEGNLYLISQSSGNTPPDFFKFDSTGQFLSQVGSYGEGEGQFGAPNGLAVDAQGNVYITDAYNVPIQKYDPSGKYIAGWAAHGTNDGEFALASGIAIDREGNLFVVDADARPSDRIQKFDSNGQFITMWDAHAEGDRATSFDMTVDSQGNIYLYIPGKNYRIIKFDPNGQVLTEFDQPVCGSTPIQTSFGGIWVDAQDQIYITDSGGSRICVFDAKGVFIGSWEGTGSYSSPIDIVGDNAGNIYVLESNRVEHFQIK